METYENGDYLSDRELFLTVSEKYKRICNWHLVYFKYIIK